MYNLIQHRPILDSLGICTEDSSPESRTVDVRNSSFGVGREEKVRSAVPKVGYDGIVALLSEGGRGSYRISGEAVGIDDGKGEGRQGEDV